MSQLVEAAWDGRKAFEAVRLARVRAHELNKDAERISAHSMMLSAYIGSLKDLRTGATPTSPMRRTLTMLVWALCAESHALALRWHHVEVSHMQMDVLTSWLVRTADYLPSRKRVALFYAERALGKCKHANGTPTQHALAHLNLGRARAISPLQSDDCSLMVGSIYSALACEWAARHESDQLQVLRQWVRILKGCGELYVILDDPTQARRCFERSAELAEGEAHTGSQAAHLRILRGGK